MEKALRRRSRGGCFLFVTGAQEAEAAELVRESGKHFLGNENVPLVRCAAADGLERRLPVELSDEEVLERFYPEVPVRARVLDDEKGRAPFLDRRDDQVGAKLELVSRRPPAARSGRKVYPQEPQRTKGPRLPVDGSRGR